MQPYTKFLYTTKSFAVEHAFWSYFFVFLMAYLESFAFVGLVMPGAGFAFSVGLMAYHGVFNIYYLIVSGFIGAVLADISSFFLAKCLRDKKIFILLKKKYGFYIQKGEKFFEKYGAVSVFIGRFVGVTRPVVPFVAGLLNMNRALFVVYSLLSGILWAISYYGTGYLFGAGLSYWNFSGLELTVLIIAVLIFCYYRYKKKDLFDDKS